jgi:hypothetical protein
MKMFFFEEIIEPQRLASVAARRAERSEFMERRTEGRSGKDVNCMQMLGTNAW